MSYATLKLLHVGSVALAFLLRFDPLAAPWLAAKIAALVLYIVLGTIALRRGRTCKARVTAFVAALAVFGYIVAVALTRTPLPGIR